MSRSRRVLPAGPFVPPSAVGRSSGSESRPGIDAALPRRALLGGLVALVACGRRSPPEDSSEPGIVLEPAAAIAPATAAATPARPLAAPRPEPPAPPGITTRTIAFGPSQGGPQQAVIVAPSGGAAGARYPLLVALGGLGETRRGLAAGAAGWLKDYWLDRTLKRLAAPPLTRDDFQDIVDPARLDAINASLAARPYRGLVIACPFTPDLWTQRSLDNAGPFARFVSERLLPRVRAEAPVERGPASTGIDGVSLGGRLSLLVALAAPGAFGAVGVTQGAFDPDEVAELAERTASALRRGRLRLRLLTTDQDYYREAIEGLHAALAAAGAEHDHLDLPGPHGYPFNRGGGAIEMLLWHDRVLRGEAPDL
jgi:enterochelin esterase-like enzyme